MSNFGVFAHGGANYPLPSSADGHTLLQDADPSLYYALQYFQSVINTYVGPRLLQEVLSAPLITNITSAVAQIVPYDPTPYLTQNQFVFPLLAVYRVKDTYKWLAQSWMDDASEWKIQYILPPLTAGQAERIGPILRAVGITILNRIENMFDPSFMSGALVWALANLEAIDLREATYGRWDAGNNLWFPTYMGTLVVKERDMPVAGQFPPLAGIDAEIDSAGAGSPVLDVSDFGVSFVDPTTIPTLTALYTADAGVTAGTNASLVGAWADQSANGLTMAPGAPANQPYLLQNAITLPNGKTKPAIRFDGSVTYLQATTATLANDAGKTLVALYRLTDTAKRSTILAHSLVGDTGNRTTAIEANTLGTAGGRQGFFANTSAFDTTITTDTSWHVVVIREANTTTSGTILTATTYNFDGAAPAKLTLNTGVGTWQTMAASNLLLVGGLPSVLSTTAASCDVGVVMAFTSALSDSDAAKAALYCRQWAGLSP
jgi:hypothetical protein